MTPAQTHSARAKFPASPPAASPPTSSTACCAAAARSTSSSTAPTRIPGLPALADRDRALVRKLVATVLRRLGTLRHLLGQFLDARLSRGRAARRDRAADRRRADPVSRRAGPRRGRSRACGWRRRTGAPRAMPGWSTRCCGGSRAKARTLLADARSGAARHAGVADGALEQQLRRRRPRARSPIAHGHEPALDLTVKADAESWAAAACAAACCRPARCAPSRTGRCSLLPGYHEGAWWVQDAAAALPARLLGDVRGQARRRSLRRARRQDRAARRRRRARHRGRPLAGPARARCARISRGLALAAEIVAADVDRMAGRAVRRRAARCAVLLDRHDPPPSRHRLAQAARPTSPRSPRCSAGCSTAPSR